MSQSWFLLLASKPRAQVKTLNPHKIRGLHWLCSVPSRQLQEAQVGPPGKQARCPDCKPDMLSGRAAVTRGVGRPGAAGDPAPGSCEGVVEACAVQEPGAQRSIHHPHCLKFTPSVFPMAALPRSGSIHFSPRYFGKNRLSPGSLHFCF